LRIAISNALPLLIFKSFHSSHIFNLKREIEKIKDELSRQDKRGKIKKEIYSLKRLKRDKKDS